MTSSDRPVKVSLLCTGIGLHRGGIESFFRECFDGLHDLPGVDLQLFKGAGPETDREHRIGCLSRNKAAAKVLGTLLRRQSYAIEQMTSLPGYVRAIRRYKPDVLFTSDAALMRRLHQLRGRIGVPFKILFSNGGPMDPPYGGSDFVHQVAPPFYEQALQAGVPENRMELIPYGLIVPEGDPVTDPAARQALRRRLHLPLDRKIILSVGWLSATHKRMDYVIREVAALPAPRPLLILLGRKDDSTPPIIQLARELLGEGQFIAESLPYEEVAPYYDAADLFVLASLTEGFGRVYIEALTAGLPAIVHDNPVMRYVLGEHGTYRDLAQPGQLAAAAMAALAEPLNGRQMVDRRQSVRARFSWSVLAPQYRRMFEKVRDLDAA